MGRVVRDKMGGKGMKKELKDKMEIRVFANGKGLDGAGRLGDEVYEKRIKLPHSKT